MSLFKIRQFWYTSSEDDEYFDQNSLIVSRFNSDFDYIVTASQSGVLRIFNPSENEFHPNDAIVEKIFDHPILQIASGRLVSGSQSVQLAVLHPKLLAVYSLLITVGKTEHGNQSYLQLLYEHKLRRSAANFVVGPFGGCQNRDFICVQSLDGIFSFFEQESQVTHVSLPDSLLPGPLAYIVKTDSFVTVSSDWGIVTYKYKNLSEAADESTDPIYSKPKLVSDWFYNLGETVTDMQVINDIINKQSWIVLLGEKHLLCLTNNGMLKFMKKLDYSPICMHAYVIDTKVFTLITAETNMLLVYENATLKWSAQFDCLPIAIHRVFLKSIKGALVLLTEEGRLECCYLGTEPSFFVAPPLNFQEIDFVTAERELIDLEKVIASFNSSDVTVQNNIDKELKVNVSVNSDIEVCIYEHNIKNASSNYMCGINIELLPQLVFQEVQVSVLVQKPLKVVPCSHFFSNLGNSTRFSSYVFLDEALDVPSLEVSIKISVITSLGVPRTITKLGMLPINLVLESCIPEKENKHKITLVTNQHPIGINNLFSDYNHDGQCSPNAIGFKSASGNAAAILLAKSSERYRLQSDTFTMLSIMVEQLIVRLKKYFNNVVDFKISFNSSLPSSDILFYVNEHFETKLCINKLQGIVSQLSGQFRLIQKRLIAKYRAKNNTSLKSLELLLNDTYLEILETTEKLDDKLEALSKSQTNLSCALNLLKQLFELFEMDSDLLKMVNSAFCINVYDLDGQSWEDVMDASLCYLLRTVMAKTEKDKLRAPHTSFDEVKDLSKFEKHLSLVLERLSKHVRLKESDPAFEEVEIHQQDNTEIQEENQRDEKPIGSQYGEFSSRLLSARKSLMKRHQIKNEPQNG